MQAYLRPDTLEQALAALAEGSRTVLSGGTDHFPLRATAPRTESVLDISALPGMRQIERRDATWRIPALATWSDILAAPLPAAFAGLKSAARQVGGVQVQNAGTIAGNLCNASPAADGIPALLALDASVELACSTGTRVLPLSRFILGPRRTALHADELLTSILIPDRGGIGGFEKLGARAYLVISIAMVGVWGRLDAGRIVEARVAVGACGPVAQTLDTLAADLVGQRPSGVTITPEHVAGLTPIDDIRAPAWYRREAARELIRRAVIGLSPA